MSEEIQQWSFPLCLKVNYNLLFHRALGVLLIINSEKFLRSGSNGMWIFFFQFNVWEKKKKIRPDSFCMLNFVSFKPHNNFEKLTSVKKKVLHQLIQPNKIILMCYELLLDVFSLRILVKTFLIKTQISFKYLSLNLHIFLHNIEILTIFLLSAFLTPNLLYLKVHICLLIRMK